MRKNFTLISIVFAFSASAQQLWSLEQCMAYAADHASSVVQARWDVASADATRNEALADFFPSVSAQVGGQLSWGRNIDPETNTYNDIATFNNGYGIYASLTIFDGGQTLNRYRQARNERKRYINSLEMKRDDCAISTMMAFADALYYLNSIKIAEDKLIQSEGMLTLTKTQEELGLKGIPEVVEAEANVANDKYSLVHQNNLYRQAMLNLRSTMNLAPDYPFSIDTVNHIIEGVFINDDPESIYLEALNSNPKTLNYQLQAKSSKYSYDIAKGNLLPNISLNAGISTSYFKNLSGEHSAPLFGEQFRNNRGEYIAATLTIPIFNGLSNISGKNRAKYAYQQAKEQLTDQQRRLHDEIVSAVMDRDGYAMEIKALTSKRDADAEAFRLNTRKYEEGLISLIDLQLSANTYYSSRVELLQKQMLFLLKYKLVEYYKGNRLWM